jgi:hypothetical protein
LQSKNNKKLYNSEKVKNIQSMKKNSENNFEQLQVDSVTGQYYVIIPEWIANELSWYEDTEIEFNLEGNEVVLSEKE